MSDTTQDQASKRNVKTLDLANKPSFKRHGYPIWIEDGHMLYDEPKDQDKDLKAFVTRFNLFDAQLALIASDQRAWASISRTAMDGLDYYINYDLRDTALALFLEAEKRLATYEVRRDADLTSRTISRNTTIYYGGMLAGILASCLLSYSVIQPIVGQGGLISVNDLAIVVLFAALGSFVSFRTRLEQIDIHKPVETVSLFLSGFMGPILAVVVAIVVYVMIQGLGLEIKIAAVSNATSTKTAMFVVAAFFCGWSERFAKDTLARIR